MYRVYARGDSTWAQGLRCARQFIAGPLRRHVDGGPRSGRLGVPAGLNAAALLARLPHVLESSGELGLLLDEASIRLLVLPVYGAQPHVLCYGPWPGLVAWDSHIEPALPWRLTLLDTRWNRMPGHTDAAPGVPLRSPWRRATCPGAPS